MTSAYGDSILVGINYLRKEVLDDNSKDLIFYNYDAIQSTLLTPLFTNDTPDDIRAPIIDLIRSGVEIILIESDRLMDEKIIPFKYSHDSGIGRSVLEKYSRWEREAVRVQEMVANLDHFRENYPVQYEYMVRSVNHDIDFLLHPLLLNREVIEHAISKLNAERLRPTSRKPVSEELIRQTLFGKSMLKYLQTIYPDEPLENMSTRRIISSLNRSFNPEISLSMDDPNIIREICDMEMTFVSNHEMDETLINFNDTHPDKDNSSSEVPVDTNPSSPFLRRRQSNLGAISKQNNNNPPFPPLLREEEIGGPLSRKEKENDHILDINPVRDKAEYFKQKKSLANSNEYVGFIQEALSNLHLGFKNLSASIARDVIAPQKENILIGGPKGQYVVNELENCYKAASANNHINEKSAARKDSPYPYRSRKEASKKKSSLQFSEPPLEKAFNPNDDVFYDRQYVAHNGRVRRGSGSSLSDSPLDDDTPFLEGNYAESSDKTFTKSRRSSLPDGQRLPINRQRNVKFYDDMNQVIPSLPVFKIHDDDPCSMGNFFTGRKSHSTPQRSLSSHDRYDVQGRNYYNFNAPDDIIRDNPTQRRTMFDALSATALSRMQSSNFQNDVDRTSYIPRQNSPPKINISHSSEHFEKLFKIQENAYNVWVAMRIVRSNCQTLQQLYGKDPQELVDVFKEMPTIDNRIMSFSKSTQAYNYELNSCRDAILTLSHEDQSILYDINSNSGQLLELLIELADDAKSFFRKERVSATIIPKHDAEQAPYYFFSGQTDFNEKNFYEFCENLAQNFQRRKTPSSVKATIVKSHLKPYAKNCIPDHLDNFDDIMEILSQKYGNPHVIFMSIIENHKKVGRIPSKTNATSDTWRKITELAGKHLTLLKRAENLVRYRPEIYQDLIHPNYVTCLAEHLSTEDHYKLFHNIVVAPEHTFRLIKEKLNQIFDRGQILSSSKFADKSSEVRSRRQRREEIDAFPRRTRRDGQSELNNVLSIAVKSNPDCLICQELQNSGQGTDLFENHVYNDQRTSVSQCPNYVKMGALERQKFLKDNSICEKCLRKLGSQHNCPGINERAQCSDKNCQTRIENCLRHADRNKDNLERKMYFASKHNMNYVMHATVHESQGSIDRNLFNGIKDKALPALVCSQESDDVRPLEFENMDDIVNHPSTTTVISNNVQAMFIYSRIKGKRRPLNVVYDTGCMSVIVRDDVVGYELPAARCKNVMGTLSGLGGNVESPKWMVSLPLLSNDGKERSIVTEAFSVRQILEPLGNINVGKIFKHFLDHPLNTEKDRMSKIKIFKYLKGSIDVLLGLKLFGSYPIPVFKLPNGLTIFKSVLKPYDDLSLYSVGGPFSTVDSCLYPNGGQVGALAPYLEHILKDFTPSISTMDHLMTAFSCDGTKSVGKFPENGNQANYYLPLDRFVYRESYQSSFKQIYVILLPSEETFVWSSSTIIQSDPPLYQVDDFSYKISRHYDKNSHPSILPQATLVMNDFMPDDSHAPINDYEGDGNAETSLLSDHDCEIPHQNEDVFGPTPTSSLSNSRSLENVNNHIDTIISAYKSVSDQRANLQDLAFMFQPTYISYRCPTCINCKNCKKFETSINISRKEHEEDFYISESIRYIEEEKTFIAKLPFVKPPEMHLTSNYNDARMRLKRVLQKLLGKEDDIKAIRNSFQKLVSLGHIKKFDDLPLEIRKLVDSKPVNYYIPWNLNYKSTSISTPVRCVFDASSKTAGPSKASLNTILAKGKVVLDFERININFRSNYVGISADISKFYNSLKLDPDHYNFQNMLWDPTFNPEEDPIRYIITTAIYGVKSSSQQLEKVLYIIADLHKDDIQVFNLINKCRYVDDICTAVASIEEAHSLIDRSNKIFSLYNLKVKAWVISGTRPDPNVSEDGLFCTTGYVYNCEKDVLQIRVPSLTFSGKKERGRMLSDKYFQGSTYAELNEFVPFDITMRMVLSRVAGVFDVSGLIEPFKLKYKTLLRVTHRETEGDWNKPISPELRKRWISIFYDQLQIAKMEFPRFNFPPDCDTSSPILNCFSDASETGKMQTVYISYRDSNGRNKSQLLFAKNQISKPGVTIPNLELDSLLAAAVLLHKCMLALHNVKNVYLFTDSTICLYWLKKDIQTLGPFQRNRIIEIFRLFDSTCFYFVSGKFNPADFGTRMITSIESVNSDSSYHKGPLFLEDLDQAIKDKIVIPLKDLEVSTQDAQKGLDGMPAKTEMPPEYFENVLALSEKQDCYPLEFDFLDNLQTSCLLNSDQLDDNVNRMELLDNIEKAYNYYPIEDDPFSFEKSSPAITDHAIVNSSSALLPYASLFCDSSAPMRQDQLIHSNYENDAEEHPITCPLAPDIDKKVDLPYEYLKEVLVVDHKINVNRIEFYSDQVLKNFESHGEFGYLVNPIKHGWRRTVDIIAMLFLFADKCRAKFNYSRKETFPPKDIQNFLLGFNCASASMNVSPTDHTSKSKIHILDMFGNPSRVALYRLEAVCYLLRKSSDEAKRNISPVSIKRHSYEEHGILFARSRITQHTEYEYLMEGVPVEILAIQKKLAYVEKYSPVTISLVHHFHGNVSDHGGVNKTKTYLNQAVIIYKGTYLIAEIVRRCIPCKCRKKKLHYVTMGPISSRLQFSYVGRSVAMDVSGPYIIRRGNLMTSTRGVNATIKIYLLHTICIVSHYVQAEILLDYSSDECILGFSRMACHTAFPKKVYMDASASEIRAMHGSNFRTGDLINGLFCNFSVETEICGTGSASHSRNGLVERKIGKFKEFLKQYTNIMKGLTYTQFDTVVKNICSTINSMPLALKERTNKSYFAEFITPRSFMIGMRGDGCSSLGVSFPSSRSSVLEGLDRISSSISTFYASHIGSFLLKSKWNKDSDDPICLGDLVFFEHVSSAMSSTWKLGIVKDLEVDSDGETRIVTVEYSNANETKYPLDKSETTTRTLKHNTRKGVHTVSKIYTINDREVDEDLRKIIEYEG